LKAQLAYDWHGKAAANARASMERLRPVLERHKVDVDDDDLQDRLDEAMGYAAVWNWEKAEAICDEVLAETDDPDLEAHAHWVKAVAFANFNLEYRTERLKDKFEAETAILRRLKPDLLGDTIAHLEAKLLFYLSPDPDMAARLQAVRAKILRDASPEAPAPLVDEDDLSDPAAIYKLGHAYWAAATLTSGTLPENSREYFARARVLMKRAAELRPDCFECGGYYVTVLSNMGLHEEAERVAKQLLERFDGKLGAATHQRAGQNAGRRSLGVVSRHQIS
jgi:hypothetical protein